MNNITNTTLRTMVLLLMLATSPVILGTAHGQIGPSDPIDCEPLLVYDVSGHGIAGPIHKSLMLYSDGLVSYSSRDLSGLAADVTWVSPELAQEINDDLIAAGALELGDRRSDGVADFPMTTITVFNGSQPNAVYNVFSFFDIDEARGYGAVTGIIEAFITQTFFE